MKYLKTKNIWKAINVYLNLNDNKVEAYSYNWWKFVTTDSRGRVYFNNTTYSNTTSRHQYKVARKLKELKIQIAYKLQFTRDSFDCHGSIKKMLGIEAGHIETKIKELKILINKKGTRKAKNKDRIEQIKTHEKEIVKIKELMK